MTHPEQALSQAHNRGPEMEAYKPFVLSCQAFVSNQKDEKEGGHFGKLPLLPSHDPSPHLSAYQGVCLTPRFPKLSHKTVNL